jgi:hypothetical protein
MPSRQLEPPGTEVELYGQAARPERYLRLDHGLSIRLGFNYSCVGRRAADQAAASADVRN